MCNLFRMLTIFLGMVNCHTNLSYCKNVFMIIYTEMNSTGVLWTNVIVAECNPF